MIRLVKQLHRDSVQEEIDSDDFPEQRERYYLMVPAETRGDGTVTEWSGHSVTERELKSLREKIDDEIDR